MPHNPAGATVHDDTPFTMREVLVPLITIIIGIFMVVLDSTAVNVALPKLITTFKSPLETVEWVVTGYTLAQAAVIPLAGWLSDRYGAKPVFLLSVFLFTVGSVLCSTAQSTTMLIAFRVLQGIGGGCVLPVAMAYIYKISPPNRVGSIMGIMGIPILFAPAIGPVLGGWLVQYHSWRWIFLLNLPIGIVGLAIGAVGLPVIEKHAVAALDKIGAVLGPLAFASLCFGVSQGSTSWTSQSTIAGLVIGVFALIAFIIVELRVQHPLLELRVFKSIDFSIAIIVQWVGQIALFGSLFLVPFFLQQVRTYGAFDSGKAILPQAITAAIFMPIGGILFDKIGARWLVVSGVALVGLGTAILGGVTLLTQSTDIVVPLALTGAGMGLMLMSLNTHLINAAPRALVSRVTSLSNALQQVINSLTIAGLTTLLTANILMRSNAAHIKVRPSSGASALGFDDTFHVMVVVAILGAIMGLLLRRIPTAPIVPREDGIITAAA